MSSNENNWSTRRIIILILLIISTGTMVGIYSTIDNNLSQIQEDISQSKNKLLDILESINTTLSNLAIDINRPFNTDE